jgi:hypothetical protein
LTKKIAIIGSAPSSVGLAPYHDPSYEIWACSPGAWPHLRRIDTFFELHSRTLDPTVFSPEYIKFLAQAPRTFVVQPWPELPRAELYPFDAMIEKYGPFWFSSSVSWMFALAIEERATEIGLWGIDMAAREEYVAQRHACQWWIEKAQSLGIKVTLPIESDLNKPFPLYGLCETDPMYVKLCVREKELVGRWHVAKENFQKAEKELAFLEGAVDDIAYMKTVWVSDRMMQKYDRPKLNRPPKTNTNLCDPKLTSMSATEAIDSGFVRVELPEEIISPSKHLARRKGRNGASVEG